jgi:hypothetical protein
MLGPLGAPQVAAPTPFTQLTQEIGQFPEQQRQAQLQQADADMATLQSSTQRLSVLNKMIAANQGLAGDPNIISAAQRAFRAMGLDAPMTSANGKQSLDARAMGAYAPAQDFIAQNLPTILQTDPEQRSAMIQAVTGITPSQDMMDALNKLPRKYLQSPAEATGLLTYVRQAVQGLSKPGGSIDNAIAAIESTAKPLSEIGIDTNMLVAQLKPDLYAQALQAAQLQLMQAKTADEQAKAKVLIDTLPAKMNEIQSTADLKRVMEQYYPQMAQAATTRANAAAQLTQPRIDELKSQTDKNHADTQKLLQDVASGTRNGKDLLSNANQSQHLYGVIEAEWTQAQADATAHANDPEGKALQASADQLYTQMLQAQKDSASAQQAYTAWQAKASGHAPGGAPHGPPADMRPGTVEHYNALDAAGKAAYIQNPNVPQDVRDYLKSLP